MLGLNYHFDEQDDILYVRLGQGTPTHATHSRPSVVWHFDDDDQPVALVIYDFSRLVGRRIRHLTRDYVLEVVASLV